MKIIIALFCTLIFASCEHWDDRFKVQNISKDTLYVAVGSNDNISSALEINYDIKEAKGFTLRVSPEKTIIISRSGRNFWDSYIEHADNKKLRVFTITKKDFDNNRWEQIGEDKLYRKVVVNSLSDMEKQSWNIEVE